MFHEKSAVLTNIGGPGRETRERLHSVSLPRAMIEMFCVEEGITLPLLLSLRAGWDKLGVMHLASVALSNAQGCQGSSL